MTVGGSEGKTIETDRFLFKTEPIDAEEAVCLFGCLMVLRYAMPPVLIPSLKFINGETVVDISDGGDIRISQSYEDPRILALYGDALIMADGNNIIELPVEEMRKRALASKKK